MRRFCQLLCSGIMRATIALLLLPFTSSFLISPALHGGPRSLRHAPCSSVHALGTRRLRHRTTLPSQRGRSMSQTRCQVNSDDPDGGRQGSLKPGKGPDPLAPYCTESEAIFTGEYYNSGDGTKVLELPDGSVILQRRGTCESAPQSAALASTVGMARV